jgi:asparagine synthase (glutamine-hydrolysing)
MCGIYGITAHDPEFIQQYIKTCGHRGPDASKVWWDPEHQMTLGHNLLSIMAHPQLSIQPWKTPKGNTLVYNGEIFNYHELKETYKGKGFAGITGCDTELLAWGLDEFGLDFLDKLDSMHGFAYYDKRKQTLCLSRDHAGIKPLYYAHVKQGLVFGSEIKGMLDIVPNARTLDHLACSMLTRAGTNPLRNTLFTNIKKVLPGETLTYDIKKQSLDLSKRIYIKPNADQDYAKNDFKKMFADTVKRSAIGIRKIGVFLSGGLDSSIIAYELNKITDTVHSFTNRFAPEVGADEDYNSDSKIASKFAKEQKFNHHDVLVSPAEYLSAWHDSIYYMEQPNYNPSNPIYCYTNKVLADNDIVVTMAGDMGDELFGGYPKYLNLYHSTKKPATWKDLLLLWMQRIKKGSYPITNDPVDDEILVNELEKCYGEDLWNPGDPTASYMALDCVAQVPEQFLIRNDSYGMSYSMEGRFPLASKQFMQYCLNIKSEYKFQGNDMKSLIKKSYSKELPEYLLYKQKTGWTVPIGYWLIDEVDDKLNEVYDKAIGKDKLKLVRRSQKTGKSLLPEWQVKNWKEIYKIK